MDDNSTGGVRIKSTRGIRPAVRFVVDGYRRLLAAMATTAFLGGTAEALFLVTVTGTAFAVAEGRDQVDVLGRSVSVNQTLLIAAALVGVRLLLGGFAAWQSARIASRSVANIRRRLAHAFLGAAWEIQQDQETGSIQQIVVGHSNQAQAVMLGVSATLLALANLTAMLILALLVDPLGALVMLVSVVVLAILLRPLRTAVRRRAKASTQAAVDLASTISEVSQLGMELHVFHVQDDAEERVAERIDRAARFSRRLQFASGTSTILYSALAYVALLAALAVVAVSDTTDLAQLGAAMLVMLRSLGYGQGLQSAFINVSSSTPAIDELIERLDFLEDGRRHDGGQPVESVGAITVDDVSFAYEGSEHVLRRLSIRIEQREIVGIVGPSGGGKSTFVQLLLGLRDPQRGRVLVGGRDVRELDKEQWARKVTFVPQAAHLISGSIAENIRFFRDVSDEAIERAARLAHVHDDITGFRDGYERHVGGQGGHLSGGQQQRICIARALVESPEVLILDEPTSALDVRSEHLVRTTLLGLKEQMTIIVIAHRLSTLDICDRIMVIQDGELMGFDTPSNLERSNDFYRESLELSGMR